MFYCALNATDAIVWQDGEQTLNAETNEVEPIGFIPTFVCEWDGTRCTYKVVFGELCFGQVIPFSGWDTLTSQ